MNTSKSKLTPSVKVATEPAKKKASVIPMLKNYSLCKDTKTKKGGRKAESSEEEHMSDEDGEFKSRS